MLRARTGRTDIGDHGCLAVASERIFKDFRQLALSVGDVVFFEG